MEGELLNIVVLLYFTRLTSGTPAIQAQLDKEKSLRAEVGPELIGALEDGTRIRPSRVFHLLPCVYSQACVRYLTGQANRGHLRPCRGEGGNTKSYEEA